MIIDELYTKKLIDPPRFLANNTMFVGITGSFSYGVSQDTSDMDLCGFCIPPKEYVFPHLSGEIFGFGKVGPRFEQFSKHHIDYNNKNYDITIYNIVKFFNLCMQNNPNMIDMLYLPRRCVLHSTSIYETIRESRDLFLHKGAVPKFRGFAFSEMSKLKKVERVNLKRQYLVDKFGYDTKNAYHIVRLLLEIEMILSKGTLDLECNSKILKAVREGEMTLQSLQDWVESKEKALEIEKANSKLPEKPREADIKKMLLNALESHYGNLDTIVKKDDYSSQILNELDYIIDKYR